MKTCLLIFCLFAAGCVTTTAPDGTRRSQTDAKTIKAVSKTFAEIAIEILLRSQP
jgi:hypothetical protein